jgi:hypothetical protein
MKPIIICLMLFAGDFAMAQNAASNKSKPSVQFGSINQLGILNGGSGVSYAIQSINGVQMKSWFIGAGVGIDMYSKRSVPVFIEGRKWLGQKANKPFIYGGAGLNFTWLNFIEKEKAGLPYSTWPGLYMDAGFGVRVLTSRSLAVVMSAGYSLKQSKETVESSSGFMPWPNPAQQYSNVEYLDSRYRRIVVKFGIQIL